MTPERSRAAQRLGQWAAHLADLWRRLFGGDPSAAPARALYGQIVAQARRAEFYRAGGVPDSLDGRFELMSLHAFLILHRLKGQPSAAGLAQALVDAIILDLDRSLRELGAGDLGIARRVKAMAQGLYGRLAAYDAGLRSTEPALQDALRRNLFGTVEATPAQLTAAALYVRHEAAALERQDLAAFLSGVVAFGPPPGCQGGEAR